MATYKTVDEAKAGWTVANKAGDKAGMSYAKAQADALRGYITNASGTSKIGELPKNPIAQAVANPPKVTDPGFVASLAKGTITGGNPLVANNAITGNPLTVAPTAKPEEAVVKTAPTTPATPAVVQKPAVTPPPAVDNSSMISSSYGSLVDALKAQIAQSVNNKNQAIAGLEGKYQPDINASAVAQDQQIHSLNEMAANAGDRGGIGRQNTLAAMVGGENRVNAINMQRKAEEAQLRNDIANLTLEGDVQAATYKAQELKDLIANGTDVNNTNYQRGFDQQGRDIAQTNADRTYGLDVAGVTGKYNGQDTLEGKTYNLQERQAITESTGFDPVTGLPSAAEKWRTKEFDATEAQRDIENLYRKDTFDYQKVRDSVADEQWSDQFNQVLDEFEWSKNPNNPTVYNAILQNKILDLQRIQLPKTQALELKKLSQDLSAGEVSILSAKAQIKEIEANVKNINANTGKVADERANLRASTYRTLHPVSSGGSSGSSGSGSSGPGAESAHYGDTVGAINNYLKGTAISDKDANNAPRALSSYMNDPYSVPYQRVAEIIANSDTTPAEKKQMDVTYGIKPK